MEEEFVRLAWPVAVAVSVWPAFAQYAGPAILSRGDAPAAMSSAQVDFRPFVNVAGIYSAGLSGLQQTSQGAVTLGNLSSFGSLLSFGVSGLHSWKHTKLGLDYLGSISHYFQSGTYGNFNNQSLLLSLTRELTPHAMFTLRENASISSQPVPIPSLPQSAAYDPSSAYNPITDYYDNRTTFLSTEAGLTFQKSARLSFQISGMASVTERQIAGLYSVTGASATGDVQYRISSHTTVGGTYTYNHFEFHGIFNATDVQSVSGTYAKRLTRSLELSAYGGFSRNQTKFLTSLPISPAIGLLLGLRSAAVINYSSLYHPNYSARLSQTFQRGVLFAMGSYSVSPGNGLFLTSTAINGSTGYNYTGLRLWSIGATAGYTRSKSISNVVGEYADFIGTLSLSRQLTHYLHLTSTVSAVKYQSNSFSGYNRLTYNANLGLAFSPGNVPLRLW